MAVGFIYTSGQIISGKKIRANCKLLTESLLRLTLNYGTIIAFGLGAMKYPSILKTTLGAVTLALLSSHAKAISYADVVVSVTPGSGSGVVKVGGSLPGYTGPTGNGTYDATAVTLGLDGVSYALGGTAGSPGSITVKFSNLVVVDGAGADLVIYDSFGAAEGFKLEASADGLSWSSVGTYTGTGPQTTTTPAFSGYLYSTFVDLAGSGLTSVSYFRITVAPQIVSGFPQALDLDAVGALNHTAAAVPDNSTTAFLLGLSVAGFVVLRRRWTIGFGV